MTATQTPPIIGRLGFARLSLCLVAALMLFGATSATAAPAKARWLVESLAKPTSFAPEECRETPEKSGSPQVADSCDTLLLTVTNVGSKASSGTVTVSDEVPVGLRVITNLAETETAIPGRDMAAGTPIPCAVTTVSGHGHVQCSYASAVSSEDILKFQIAVEVEGNPSPGPLATENEVTVSGGGATTQTINEPVVIRESEPFRLLRFGFEPRGADGEGDALAGAHPNIVTNNFEIPTRHRPNANAESKLPVESLKDAFAYLPLGIVGNPQAAESCPLATIEGSPEACPAASKVGRVRVENFNGIEATIASGTEVSSLYNLVPEGGYPAEFGFTDKGKLVTLTASLVHVGGVGGGYAIRVGATGIPNANVLGISGLAASFWGSPAAHNGATTTPKSFLTNPTNCSGPLKTKMEANSWERPGVWSEIETQAYPQLEECQGLSFSPSFQMRPQVTTSDTPSGYEAVLTLPQNQNVAPARATAQLKDARVTLPEGVALSASAANGLAGCAATGPEGINIGSDNIGHAGQDLGDPEATELGEGHEGGNSSRYDDGIYHTAPGHCPDASRIGSLEMTTPLLEEPAVGQVYVAKPTCSPCTEADAVNGKLYGIYLEAEAPKAGVIVKLHGEVSANPQTGRLTATFRENPQLPFEKLRLKFDGGSLAALANPQTCGTYKTETDFIPWSTPQTPDATPDDSFSIDAGANGGVCIANEAQAPNAPSFEAGTTNPLAGTYSPFVLKVGREDGSQRLERLNLTLPPGLVGKLAGIPYCSDVQIAAAANRSGKEELASSSCPAASEVGKVTVGAGPGAKPYYVTGHAYLAGPYKGAPLSLAIVTPAVAGPFDLGTVVVRSALYVNEETAQISVKSDPIPRILDGTPVDVRSIAVEMNRSQFTLNPTDCEAMSVGGEAISVAGQTANLTNRFQVGGCGALGFKPRLKLSLKGGTKRAGHPALKAVVTYPKEGAYANIARAQVGLPHSEFIDQGNLDKVCTQPELKSNTCPASSVYGHAKAWTPLLDEPLEGPVYLGVGYGHALPDVVADLNGQIRILLHGKVDTTKRKGLRNTFELVPDAPVSRFMLELKGGKRYGLFENSENVCGKTQRANARFVAQNGRVAQLHPKIANGCGAGKKRSAHKHRAH